MREYYPGLNPHLKAAAATAVLTAKNRGELVPAEKCSICMTAGPVHGHHDDYAKPLDVRWLCSSCHRLDHMRNTSRPAEEMGGWYGGPSESGSVTMRADLWAYVRARAKEERRTVRAVFEAIVDAARGVAS